MASYAEGKGHRGLPRLRQVGILAAKLAVTGVCFWYLARNVDPRDLVRAAGTLDLRWAGMASLLLILEIPIVALRWSRIVDALEGDRTRIRRRPIIAITAIGGFFAQVMPNIAADTVRAWMLTQLGRGWGQSLISVMIDRAVGVAALVAVGLVVLLFPSALTALGGHRDVAIELFAGLLVAGLAALLLAPRIAPILESWRYSAWVGQVARAAHYVLVGSPRSLDIVALAAGVHVMTIVSVWMLAQALGLSVSVLDAAVLFTVMLAAALIPISISGWGVRELAVTSLLGSHGVPLEQALFFSVCFGLVLLVAALPGAVVWAVYSPARSRPAAASSR